MKVTNLKPPDKLAEYVQDILVIENDPIHSPFILPLFANGTPTLLFQTAKAKTKSDLSHLTLFGQTVSPDKLIIEDKFTLIAYFFKPYTLMSLFGFEAAELTDSPVDYNLLSNKYALQEQLLNAATTHHQLSILNYYILRLIAKNTGEESIVKYATEKISNNFCPDVLCKIRYDLRITERTFQRLFNKNIGVSPNQFRKINQFKRAFQQLNRKQFRRLSDIAFDNFYADQSHYIRVFREFTNITPRDYLCYNEGL